MNRQIQDIEIVGPGPPREPEEVVTVNLVFDLEQDVGPQVSDKELFASNLTDEPGVRNLVQAWEASKRRTAEEAQLKFALESGERGITPETPISRALLGSRTFFGQRMRRSAPELFEDVTGVPLHESPLIDFGELVPKVELLTQADPIYMRLPEFEAIANVASGLTTPVNLSLIAGTSLVGTIPALVSARIPQVAAGLFSVEMARDMYHRFPLFQEAMDAGDIVEARKIITEIALTGGMAGLGAKFSLLGKGQRVAGLKIRTEPGLLFDAVNFIETRSAKSLELAGSEAGFIKLGQPASPPPGTLAADFMLNIGEAAGQKISRPFFRSLYTDFVNKQHPVDVVMNQLRKIEGVKIGELTDVSFLMRLLAGDSGKADYFIQHGPFKAGSLEVTGGRGLRQIIKDAGPQNEKIFGGYVAARRARELEARGIKTGMKPEQIDDMISRYDSAKFRGLHEELQGYQDDLLQYLIDTGVVSAKAGEKMRALGPDYAPFNRVVDEASIDYTIPKGRQISETASSVGSAIGDVSSPIKRIKGSERKIVPVFESMLKNTYRFINTGGRNQVGVAVLRLIEQNAPKKPKKSTKPFDPFEPVGPLPLEEGAFPSSRVEATKAAATNPVERYFKVVKRDVRPTEFQLKDIKKELSEAGFDTGSLSDVALEAHARIFRPEMYAPRGKNMITVFDNGKPVWVQMHPEIYRVFKELDVEQVQFLAKALAAPAKLLRLGATGIAPEFVIRNPVRDAWAAWVQSKNMFTARDWGFGIAHAISGGVGKPTETFLEWQRSGGPHAALVSLDRTHLQSQLKDMLSGPVRYTVRHPIEALRIFSEYGEMMTRLGEFSRARARGKSIRQSGFDSREVTLDFQRHGAKTKQLNAITAFFNAAVQGTDKFARMHAEQPVTTPLKAFVGITMPSIALYAINHDDPRYQERPEWEKDFFWHIPTDTLPRSVRDTSPFILVPKPFLWGMVYANTFERAARDMWDKDPQAWRDYLTNLYGASAPNIIPTFAIPILEGLTNYSFFTGRQQIPKRLENLDPRLQFEPWTGEYAKAMSRALAKIKDPITGESIKISPIRIEAALFSWTGGLGKFGRYATNGLFRPEEAGERAAPSPADIPLLRGFVVRDPTTGTSSFRTYWENRSRLEEKKKSWSAVEASRDPETGISVLDPHNQIEPLTDAEAVELAHLEGIGQLFSEAQRQIRAIDQTASMTGEEKRTEINAILKNMSELARDTVSGLEPPQSGQNPTVINGIPTFPAK